MRDLRQACVLDGTATRGLPTFLDWSRKGSSRDTGFSRPRTGQLRDLSPAGPLPLIVERGVP